MPSSLYTQVQDEQKSGLFIIFIYLQQLQYSNYVFIYNVHNISLHIVNVSLKVNLNLYFLTFFSIYLLFLYFLLGGIFSSSWVLFLFGIPFQSDSTSECAHLYIALWAYLTYYLEFP